MLAPPDEGQSEWLLEAMEARIRQAETFAWAVPALALTAQAFILNVAFDNNVPWGGRSIAAFSGVVILLAALHLLGKHSLNFDVYEAVIDRERAKLGLSPVSRNALLGIEKDKDGKLKLEAARRQVDTFPTNTGFRDRDWLGLYLRNTTWGHRRWVKVRRRLVFEQGAVRIWAIALGALAAMDLLVGLYSADPGWEAVGHLLWEAVSLIYEWLADAWRAWREWVY